MNRYNQGKGFQLVMECWIFSAECGPALFDHRLMDEIKENATQLRKTQAPIALRSLQTAITAYVEDMNIRLQAGLAVRETPTSFEVHELEKDTLLSLSLTGENNIYYTQLVKRRNEMESGTIYVRASLNGAPTILFSDFPRTNVEVSYQEASKRLLNSSF